MKKDNLKIFSYLMTVLCLLIVIGLGSRSIYAEENTKSIAPKKIISIVYDDSGSMQAEGRAVSANYATQVFAALMNPQDELYITYMSDLYEIDGSSDYKSVSKETGDLIDLSDPAKAVGEIRSNAGAEGYWTPLRSVEVGMETLNRVSEDDPNTQFWLVIMTDGEMFKYTDAHYNSLSESLDAIKNTAMSNGTILHIYYFGIGTNGNGVEVIEADPENQLEAVNEVIDIVPELGDVANAISGRLKYDTEEITVIDDTTISVKSDMALHSLSAFSQNSYAQVISVSVQENESQLTIDRNVSVEKQNDYGAGTLFGNIAVINNGEKAIPAGEYFITFSESIDINSTVIMYQPAIELRIKRSVNDFVLDDTDTVNREDTVSLSVVPVDPYTGLEIDPEILPDNTDWEITIASDEEAQKYEGRTAAIENIEAGTYTIGAAVAIPGMIPIKAENISFTVDEYVPDLGVHMTIVDADRVIFDNVDHISELTELQAGETVSVYAEVYDKNYNTTINEEEPFGNGNWSLTHQINGSETGSVQDKEYKDIILDLGSNAITSQYVADNQYENQIAVYFDVNRIKLADRYACQKYVAIVYDDSESMAYDAFGNNAKQYRAYPENYAVQAFAALMNEQDELHITYMSNVVEGNKTSNIYYLSDIDQTVAAIADSGDPVGKDALSETIETAVEDLKTLQASDEEAQYWVLVLSDGIINPETEGYNSVSEIMDQYKGTTMENGTELNLYYVGLENESTVESDPEQSFWAVNDVTDIISAVKDASNVMFGRIAYETENIEFVDDRTVILHFDESLDSLSIVLQNTPVKVVSAQTDSEYADYPLLEIERNTNISKGDMYGCVSRISNGAKVIPAGNITLSFSGKINLNSLSVLYQPVEGGSHSEAE